MASQPAKRIKLDSEPAGSERSPPSDVPNPASIRSQRAMFLNSISRSISPPRKTRSGTTTPPAHDGTQGRPVKHSSAQLLSARKNSTTDLQHRLPTNKEGSIAEELKAAVQTNSLPSPFKLTSIRDLPSSQNVDTISLHDILGNPLIKEAWIFNFCFDVDWVMTHFDPDTRAQVKVKIVHGSWKSEDSNKLGIDDACRRWSNVESVTAYLPDPFGTHHSKMFILFTHDDQAQVVIHTANMLEKDWTNMTQAVWQSPMLPILKEKPSTTIGKVGSGSRFKSDLLAYVAAYGSKTKALREQLEQFDFSKIRGALIASVPSRMKDFSLTQDTTALWDQKLWGYPSLFRAVRSILPRQSSRSSESSDHHLVCQISSIATIPLSWLNQFFPPLLDQPPTTRMFNSISIIYPTPKNVGSSLDGYASGGSIHTKAQSTAHIKQITTLRKSLCQWTHGPNVGTRAQRDTAAPHIKTYVRFKAKPTMANPTPDVDWALLTSANLSTQAWGTLREKDKEVVVQSFEIGVLVWPGMFDEAFDTGEGTGTRNEEKDGDVQGGSPDSTGPVKMIPVFGKDTPSVSSAVSPPGSTANQAITVVGLRLPYDLPLTPYAEQDLPWSPQGTYNEPDRFGRRWPRDFF